MAYRRRQPGLSDEDDVDSSSSSNFLAAKAIKASSATRDSSLSSAYSSPLSKPNPSSSSQSQSKDPGSYNYTSMKSLNESKSGFWGNLARKAKAILDDQPSQDLAATETTPKEGISIVENRTAGIIQETRKHIKKKPGNYLAQKQATKQPHVQAQAQTPTETDQELQLKASRDVAMAMAAKAKLLLRELKTVKADLAFAKERCAQLEEQNKVLLESRERGNSSEDDDLIRLQLETLLAEKARLAHENSVYARENRFLREVVEYHQLTMQDVVYLDEGTEEVTEVYPIKVVSNTHAAVATPLFPPSPVPPEGSIDTSFPMSRDVLPCPPPLSEQRAAAPSSSSQ
ncbi:uncharacterized protein LOC123212597 isoform X2 [Mangifera indica]|uniref:uncharacterized protein LOC123212597 isoform X2 n=1 Tax=Mangifera indica TaxID=29780 RepID=UPI001CFA83C4|nr:uncharacterized protein LOC123212597 isoform X2 [Mangifera indica]